MKMLSQRIKDELLRTGVRWTVLLSVLALGVGCSSGEGVQLGTGQDPDPVIVDFPIAFIKAPLQLDDNGDIVQTEALPRGRPDGGCMEDGLGARRVLGR